jgi:hypothetical protein
MASLRLYGDPVSRENAERVLLSYGAAVEAGDGNIDREILRRVASQVRSAKNTSDSQWSAKSPEEFEALLARRPDLLGQTLVVRGRSYMLGSDPSRLQSLMY